jgi:hypothetical protein
MVLVLFSGRAMGEEFKLIPSAALKEEYNDNIFFSANDKESNFITTLSSGLALTTGTERLNVRLLAGIDGILHADNEDFDAVDQNYYGRLHCSVGPRTGLFAEVGFARDSRADRDIETTGLVTGTVRRDRQNGAISFDYALYPKTSAVLSCRYEQDDYEDPEYSDIKSHSATLVLAHDLGSLLSSTTGRVNIGYTGYLFANSKVDNYTGTVGASRAFSETWSLLVDVGARLTRSEFEVAYLEFVPPLSLRTVVAKETSCSRGWIGQAAFSYHGEMTSGSLTFNRDVMTATGRTGTTERTALIFDLRRKWTSELSGHLSAGYYLNKSGKEEFATKAIDEKTLRIKPWIRYELTQDMAVEAAYQYTRVIYGQSDAEADQNLFSIHFLIKYPLF